LREVRGRFEGGSREVQGRIEGGSREDCERTEGGSRKERGSGIEGGVPVVRNGVLIQAGNKIL
jgi:hypothetical protein